ncbi:efflux RND transporter periplasmic adaptor subunit [Glaciimonas immobilis]|uniref:Cobalt-zinc-cadmium efflux system membrane fusion protein n=1 Tax=Glaciimonas immobilis TaxID=728004 RepID=A0A840RRS3_9BURK|nr:efflux RND transporter periplasmic adaptor subunit [Glaciimonas immobilis]KAF3998035.1 efflux RND transporter periplasmic adaptor subunit [Glaciimonas immobilis]MBB5199280.1 cobalt-zinc-cadmium efflux system membrane fusion protein [Glaciimonas immobilis]
MQKILLQPKKPLFVLAAVVLVIASIGWLTLGNNAQDVARAAQIDAAPTPNFVRLDEQIFVPFHSPLRDRIVVQPVSAMDTAHTVELPAQVEANPAQTINIVPPATGKLLELKVGLGDHVKKGQLLMVMTSGDFAQATSDQQKAHDTLQLTKKGLERQRGVQDAGAGAAKDFEQAESANSQAQAEFTRADTRLKSLGTISADSNGRRLNILAPTSGSVTALSVGVGQSLNDPSAVLMTIANLENVWITANVPENLLSSVRTGQSVTIRLPAYAGAQLNGNVQFVSDVLQPDTRRALVRISMPNVDGKLKPNMFATATFAVAQTAAPVVPTSALLMNNDDTTVFVETASWTFIRRKVELGREGNGSVRIQTGLRAGERVVIQGGVLLND